MHHEFRSEASSENTKDTMRGKKKDKEKCGNKKNEE
jgi:hypothetical protein